MKYFFFLFNLFIKKFMQNKENKINYFNIISTLKLFILCKNEKRTILMHVVTLSYRKEWVKNICNKILRKLTKFGGKRTQTLGVANIFMVGGGGGAHCAPLGLCRVKNDNQMFLPTYRYKYKFYTTWCAYTSQSSRTKILMGEHRCIWDMSGGGGGTTISNGWNSPMEDVQPLLSLSLPR